MNDIDVWQEALKDIDMNEAVQFVSRGKLIVEDSQVEMYNKIQALLNCPELECSHRFLYSLDPEELTEAEATKVCNLYKLGQERGFLEPDDVETPADVDVEVAVAEKPVADVQPVQIKPIVPQTAYTVLYSAMRNGNIATGEAYSNAIDPRSAKADAISQLEKAGYTNIAILAIECGDPDCCGRNSPLNAQKPNLDVVEEPLDTPAIPDYAAEDDMLDNRPHNNHVSEDDVAEDDMLDGRKHNLHVDEAGEEDNDEGQKDDEGSKEADDADAEKQDAGADDADKEEQAKEPDEKLSDKDAGKKAAEEKPELDAAKKAALKDSYKKAFKAAMLKCKFEDKKFEDLTLDEKVKFFTALSEAWGDKEDPSLFMTDKELDQLEKIVVKK